MTSTFRPVNRSGQFLRTGHGVAYLLIATNWSLRTTRYAYLGQSANHLTRLTHYRPRPATL